MAKPYDSVTKEMLERHPRDWMALLGLPGASRLRVVDADLAAVTAAADKVIRVGGADPYLAHLEFQAGHDKHLDERVLWYNVLLRWRHRLRVRSVVLLLRPEAEGSGTTGQVVDPAPGANLLFTYRLVRIWELSPELLLRGGFGTLPLAPLTVAKPREARQVILKMAARIGKQAPRSEQDWLWAATYLLLGLRHPAEVVQDLLRGVRGMKESTTYQAILEEGLEKGLQKGRQEGRREGRDEELRKILMLQGEKRLGPLHARNAARLAKVSDLAHLERLAERILTVDSWEALLAEVRPRRSVGRRRSRK